MDEQEQIAPFHPKKLNAVPLFIERVSAYWIAIWKCWRIVIDWAVWLYIFIPGIFILGGMYGDLIRNPRQWLFDIPIALLFTVVGIVQVTGRYRTFAEPGDGLFLHRVARWVRSFTLMGFLYSFLCRGLFSTLIVGFLAPLFLHIYSLTVFELIALAIYFTLQGFLWILLKDRVTIAWVGWKRTVILLIITPTFLFAMVGIAVICEQNTILMGAISLLLVAIAAMLMRLRLRVRGTLQHEIAVESAAYIASVGWILKDTMEKRAVPKLRGPMLFKYSRPLVKHRDDATRLLDSWLKSSLRRSDLWHPILYTLGAGAAAIVLTPLILSLIVWFVLPMLVLGWVQRQWLLWLSEPYVALFQWEEETLKTASLKAKLWGGIPFITIWSILLGVKAGLVYGAIGWLAIGVIPVAGYFWLKLISETITSIGATRGRKKE